MFATSFFSHFSFRGSRTLISNILIDTLFREKLRALNNICQKKKRATRITTKTTMIQTIQTIQTSSSRVVRGGGVFSKQQSKQQHRRRQKSIIVTKAATDDDDTTTKEETEDEFEAKLGALRGKRSKRSKGNDDEVSMVTGLPKTQTKSSSSRLPGVRDFMSDFTEEPKTKDWGPEQILYEGPPARGEVVANVLMSWTVVWLPLTIQAAGRALWASYKITDKRVCVISNSPLRKERTDVPMDQIKDVISIGRGIGAWGDMVITLRNDEKVELRSLPNFKELEGEIKQRMYKEKPIEF